MIKLDPVGLYRVSRWCVKHDMPWLGKFIHRACYVFYSCYISPFAEIGSNSTVEHFGSAVVIGMNVRIGDNVRVYQGVTLGWRSSPEEANPSYLLDIGDDVFIGAGAKVLARGTMTIGARSVIAANAVVIHSMPCDSLALGIPAKISPRKQLAFAESSFGQERGLNGNFS